MKLSDFPTNIFAIITEKPTLRDSSLYLRKALFLQKDCVTTQRMAERENWLRSFWSEKSFSRLKLVLVPRTVRAIRADWGGGLDWQVDRWRQVTSHPKSPVDDRERDCLATLLCCDPGRVLVSNKCMTNGEHPRILSFQSWVFTNEFSKFIFYFFLYFFWSQQGRGNFCKLKTKLWIGSEQPVPKR